MPIFRRRRPRRRRPLFKQRTRPRSPVARAALKRLQQAHELMANEKPAEAAVIFDEMAEKASERDIPRAPQLFLQAGRAWIEAGDSERGISRLKDGLELMVKMRQLRRLPIVNQRVITELRDRGFTEQANELEVEISTVLTTHGLSSADAPSMGSKPRLPTKCPYCGGSVIPNDVEWVDEHWATCTYCGSPLEDEG